MAENNIIDFIVLSFPKSATTSLYRTLQKHPQICLPLREKIWFFAEENFSKGPDWYKDQFAHCNSGSLKGDITTAVLVDNNFPEKLKQVIPHGEIIVLLRDPLKRAVSHYFHTFRVGEETENVDRAFYLERKRKNDLDFSQYYSHYAYAGTGLLYKKSIEKLLKTYKRDNIKFVLFEELTQNPEETLKDIYKFLGISLITQTLEKTNVARKKSHPQLEKFLNIPGLILGKFPSLGKKILPPDLEKKTRKLRHKIHSAMTGLPEYAYKETKKPEISEETREELIKKFNAELKGLDKIIGKPLHKFWKWYKP